MPLLAVGCALALLLVCFRAALFGDEQFAFRDAAHFYYPLYLRVQQEWQSGRWPLWDPGQNGGQPLLGSPMAAVLYPGKLIYALLPYAWAVRIYVVAHTVLAFAGIMVLARSLGISWVGAGLGGLSYAFGGPVLFQYDNVIYLVGASWVPWGLLAVDRLVRLRRPRALAGLAVVLAMQVLGGDPQAAYMTVLCGAGYAAILALRGNRIVGRLALALVVVWLLATPLVVYRRISVPGWFGTIWAPAVLGWLVLGCWLVGRWRQRSGSEIGSRLAVLVASGALALAISAAQLVPMAEFTMLSSRTAGSAPMFFSKFSMEPFRLVEFVWPEPFGWEIPVNRGWIQLMPPIQDRQMWVPSLYIGGLAILLAVGGFKWRGAEDWRLWMMAIAAVSLVASFGRFGGPLWWLRCLPGLESAIGAHDPLYNEPRAESDPFPYDVEGSPFALAAALVPGFGLFRYPAKLFTFTVAALAVLTGAGWDEVAAGRSKWFARSSAVGLVASAVGLVLAWALKSQAVGFLTSRIPLVAPTGAPDVVLAWRATMASLAQGIGVYGVGLGLAIWSRRRPRSAGALMLIALSVDLAVASSRLIWTAPQALFDSKPEALRQIELAERDDPSPGPFRIFRLNLWHPERFIAPSTPSRSRELFDWERQTLDPLNGLPVGLEYCVTTGVMELEDLLDFFHPQIFPAGEEAARVLQVEQGQKICYYPRRSYDLWGVRYFILPVRPLNWESQARGYASFAFNSKVVFPKRARTGDEAERERWNFTEDWQIVRNTAAYPRAWLVHAARVVSPIADVDSRSTMMREIVFANDPIWRDPRRPVHDPRAVAWLETDDRKALMGYIAPVPVQKGESVTVTRYEPQRVELKATLTRPGIVVLSDTYYPGWRLTIDGRPAPILRTNRMMRGAAVREGEHTLVYVYDPLSFRVGMAVTALALLALLVLLVRPINSWRNRPA